jgi:hypothetical protein
MSYQKRRVNRRKRHRGEIGPLLLKCHENQGGSTAGTRVGIFIAGEPDARDPATLIVSNFSPVMAGDL